MGRHYTVREFFRQMPNALLVRYFERREVLDYLDFEAIADTDPDELVAQWLSVSDDRRRAMDAEFQDIFALSDESGFRAIIDEADWHLAEEPQQRNAFVEHLSSLPSHFDRAMVTFLDYHQFWRGAVQFHHADSLSYWRKRLEMPRTRAAVDSTSLSELATAISSHFHETEGRGKHCVVEPLRRGSRDYFFAYPEDYSQQSVEWDRGRFARRPHNPAFEVIFVYEQEAGSLDVYCRGATKALGPLQRMFAAIILDTANLESPARDERIYNLNPLRDRRFEFMYDEASGISDLRLRKLRLSSMTRKGERVTLEGDTIANRGAIHDFLARIGPGLPPRDFNVTMVELTARVSTDPTRRPTNVTFRITHPNSCTLKYDEVGLRLRRMLSDSGIEPGEPESVARAAQA
ncbi:MAG TPA: hypothetical protein VEL28_09310 [Candidatus Binatia bacterium]|nr:hypothetical protein [Candidatus Binatia bacterium]